MIPVEKLRTDLRAAGPTEALEYINEFCKRPDLPEDFRAPMMEVLLVSGAAITGYLVEASGEGDRRAYLFSREVDNDSDTAADVTYVWASRIEAVTIWNIIDYPGVLP